MLLPIEPFMVASTEPNKPSVGYTTIRVDKPVILKGLVIPDNVWPHFYLCDIVEVTAEGKETLFGRRTEYGAGIGRYTEMPRWEVLIIEVHVRNVSPQSRVFTGFVLTE